MLDGQVVHIGRRHEVRDAVHLVAAKEPHEVVLEREVELRLTGIALTAGAAAELVVDTAALVPLGADYGEAARRKYLLALAGARLTGLLERLLIGCRPKLLVALGLGVEPLCLDHLVRELLGVAAEQDVCTTACHVRRDRHSAQAAGLRNDVRLALVELCVQDLVLDSTLVEQARQALGALDGDGAHEHGLTFGMTLGNLIGDGAVLGIDRAVHEVVMVFTDHRLVGRNDLHGQVVDLAELGILGDGGTGHAGKLIVEAEVILQGDRGERLVLLAHEHALFGLDGWWRPSE